MNGSLTWSLLRDLANFRAEKGCATSLYLNLDPSQVPTPGDAQTRMNALLSSAEKTDRRELTHEQRVALKADFERIARWFDDDFERNGAQGLAVFAAGLDNFWRRSFRPSRDPTERSSRSSVASRASSTACSPAGWRRSAITSTSSTAAMTKEAGRRRAISVTSRSSCRST
jgi:hypothetical protein